jgi:radical SAM superfamily enzyme YgiQ (UPF0313 family)
MKGITLLIEAKRLFLQNEYLNNFLPSSLLKVGSFFRQMQLPAEILILADHVKQPTGTHELSRYKEDLIRFFENYQDTIDAVAISAYSSYAYIDSLVIASAIKEALPSTTIIGGGYALMSRPEDYLYHNSPFDYLIAGEGDFELAGLIQKINMGKAAPKRPPQKLPNLIRASQIDNLNLLPPIDFDLLRKTHFKSLPYVVASLNTSRGCPYKCEFCGDMSGLHGLNYTKKWRGINPSNIHSTLDAVSDYFQKSRVFVFFDDPIFGLEPNWKTEFLTNVECWHRAHDNFGFGFEDRVEHFRESDAKMIGKMDSIVMFGLESGSPEILRSMNKTQQPVSFLQKMIKNRDILESYQGIWSPFIIFGYPGETRQYALQTQNYLRDLYDKSHYGILNLQHFQFLPGSPVYQKYFATNPNRLPGNARVYYPEWHKMITNLNISEYSDPTPDYLFEDNYLAYSNLILELVSSIENNFTNNKDKPIVNNWCVNTIQEFKKAYTIIPELIKKWRFYLEKNPPKPIQIDEATILYN